jgi:hypothetical protein
MIPAGRVSMLIQFRPGEARAAATWLPAILRRSGPVVMTWDVVGGSVEVGNVSGAEVGALTDQLYRRGARYVFVRYAHEGRRLLADDGPVANGPGGPAALLN